MRYLAAMVAAALMALLATLFVSSPVASFVVRQFAFDNPDSVADLHAAVFMGLNLAALALGWVVGWSFGRRWER
jgi:vancomycin permeability regulator SanA